MENIFEKLESFIFRLRMKKLINQGIAGIYSDFYEIKKKNRGLTNEDKFMLSLASKGIDLIKAITTLLKNNFNSEALILVRSLTEHSVNMRWILEDKSGKRKEDYLAELDKSNNFEFGVKWTNVDLSRRMEEIGFTNRDYYDFLVKFTYGFAHVNASSIDWRHLLNKKDRNNFSADGIYPAMVQMVGHILKALNSRHENNFKLFEKMWKSINTNKDIRKDFEKVIKERIKE